MRRATRPAPAPVLLGALLLLVPATLAAESGAHSGHPGHHHGSLHESAGVPLATPWIPAAERRPLRGLDIAYRDQDGRSGVLGDLADKPVLITFFYSRCQNGRKCPMAVGRLAVLQRRLTEAGMAGRVRLLAITYEPQFDTPQRLRRFAAGRGLRFDDNALALRLDVAQHERLIDELEVPVAYNAGWVNAHGVQLTLLDRHGRRVRSYHTLLWDNERVTDDVGLLIAEGDDAP